MPLLDHFHPPLSTTRHWESFHAAWATQIMRTLNRQILPQGYFAEVQASKTTVTNGNGGVAVETWAPPTTSLIMPAIFPDEIEVQVFDMTAGPTLVAAVELISPGNKDRPETRRVFAAKCAAYLQAGIGLVIVDVVTERQANLHDELIDLLNQPAEFRFQSQTHLYSAAYRPARRDPGGDQIDIWLQPLALGQTLPTMALALRGAGTLPLDLDGTYMQVCEDSRL